MRRALWWPVFAAAFLSPFAIHVSLVTGRYAAVAAVLAGCQVAAMAGWAMGRARLWQRAAGLAAAALLAGLVALRLLRPGTAGLLPAAGLSHLVLYTSLAVMFASSLLPHRTPVVTALAARLHGGLTPARQHYTRSVTRMWCAFFAAQVAVSGLLALLAPAAVWSLFVNVLDLPLVAAVFAAEYAVRRWRFRGQAHVSPVRTLRAFGRRG